MGNQRFGDGQIERRRDFEIAGRIGDHFGWVSDPFRQRDIVCDVEGLELLECGEEERADKGLRSLHFPKARAIESALHEMGGAGFFDGGGDGSCERGGAGPFNCGKEGADALEVDEGARRIVGQNDMGLGRGE